MSLIPRFPEREFTSLFRLLDDYSDHLASRSQGSEFCALAPRFDVRETKEAYHLDGELPGLEPNNIEIEFSDPNTLIVKGHAERESSSKSPSKGESKDQSKDSTFWVSERSVGEFRRVFNFPAVVEQENVQAKLNNGVLSITVPKSSPPPVKRITIG
ncbi:hypothetical protein Egran_03582 [Elaphomyces granulatus]|uniref:SHSP domain-containing protein n=1 Tax=Elaphomyces granulatus TaxID=519963 RepID=A0A232LWW9_9EURO|nr:hypothetical protein Egran_03582 [Elaphomyces granulatus]